MQNEDLFRIAPEVKAALSSATPVVALESTVIAHGLPSPENIETARQQQLLMREQGVVPATIAVINGRFQVGLSDEQLQLIATEKGIKKISIRDLAVAVAMKQTGATTVASTIWIAHRAGIKVFATGGIGGVHRGTLPDVSADLPQLAQTPMVVVCSGAKIVLDLPATREWLETNGITVVGYECDEMPAFYSRSSGLAVDVRVDAAADVAHIFRVQREIGFAGALLVTVPVPSEAEVSAANLQQSLKRALGQAELQRITGRELTPFLLAHMAEDSSGATLRANIALLKNNSLVATQIARALLL
jgi:pseudouridine-5'-phosphate glycosidase